jgi:hypothetical protein
VVLAFLVDWGVTLGDASSTAAVGDNDDTGRLLLLLMSLPSSTLDSGFDFAASAAGGVSVSLAGECKERRDMMKTTIAEYSSKRQQEQQKLDDLSWKRSRSFVVTPPVDDLIMM